MKFNRAALIEACDAALAWDRATWDRRLEQDLAENRVALAAWTAANAEQWAKAGLDIRRAIREGKPVTASMLPLDRHRTMAIFRPRNNIQRTYAPPQEVVVLRRLLDTIVDEEVSSSGLDAVGITSRVMREAAKFMAQGSVRV